MNRYSTSNIFNKTRKWVGTKAFPDSLFRILLITEAFSVSYLMMQLRVFLTNPMTAIHPLPLGVSAAKL